MLWPMFNLLRLFHNFTNQWRHKGVCHPGRQLMVSPYFFLKSDDLFCS